MTSDLIVELVGYAASALIIISITQRSILRLRLIGLAGGLTFLVYALIIGAYPIAAVNLAASAIHIWYLRKLISRKEEVFRILHVRPDSLYLAEFLSFYRNEIQGRYQPEFTYEPRAGLITAFVLRDMVPAAVVTDGPQGAFVRFDGQESHVPAFACTPKDLTGAGDMFAGAFLYGITHGVHPEKAARGANFLCHKVITQIGARLQHNVRKDWEAVVS